MKSFIFQEEHAETDRTEWEETTDLSGSQMQTNKISASKTPQTTHTHTAMTLRTDSD